ncbi:MAG: helix-turn-helix domain-containing protein [Gammaproteobacteria bacterium]|nr:helix-turn-helix domain-containing protein [Gammaproteobacteria bacterium]
MLRHHKEVTLTEWISVKEAADYTGYTTAHIRYLLRNGLLQGRKFGRDWFTTMQAIEDYLATEPRPGPKSPS